MPSGCGERNAAGYYDRTIVGPGITTYLDPVCFGGCMQCGERRVQMPFMYCQRDPSVLYCENFEGMQHGLLLPQATRWSSSNVLVGAPLDLAGDIPSVTGFWNGYTNFDGSKALRVTTDNTTGSAESPHLILGNNLTGIIQLDFKTYIPAGHPAFFAADGSDFVPRFSGFFTDSLRFIAGLNPMTGEPIPLGRAIAYPQNRWNDVSVTFNITGKRVSVRLNGATVFDGTTPIDLDIPRVQFGAFDPFGSTPPEYNINEMFIDDVIVRRVTPAEPPVLGTPSTNARAVVSPNPANEKLMVIPDDRTTEDWQVRLINQLGQVVETQRGSASTPIEFNTINYQSGIYVVDFQSETMKWTKKVVIKH